ncbi:hypothetical protein F383_12268 [Gossypium arboreum]|uniref:Uncharacterized protein n=1 Tax=Gossypium arboreum TaxID=29729 RepID=A0A0B0PT34_GOSAR|nr:hypothetical protein F383_12268 [Gossypium arboreum]
MIWHSCVYRD